MSTVKKLPLWASLLIIIVVSMAMIAMALKAPGVMFVVISNAIKIVQMVLSAFLQVIILLLIVLIILAFLYFRKGPYHRKPFLGEIKDKMELVIFRGDPEDERFYASIRDLKRNKKLSLDHINTFYEECMHDLEEETGVTNRSRQEKLLHELQGLGFEFEMMNATTSGENVVPVSAEADNKGNFLPRQVKLLRLKKSGSSQQKVANK